MFQQMFFVTTLIFIFAWCHTALAVNRPRGVSLINAEFYRESEFFYCLDGSSRIPFSQVNDDYCDCLDGSDEPGTSACDNGHFSCLNLGYISSNILSSRVNDHVCDCCDGSDEYNSGKICPNTCEEFRNREMATFIKLNEGFKIRTEYIKYAADRKKQDLESSRDIEIQVAASRLTRDELKEKLRILEEPEKIAVARFEEEWNALKNERQQAEDNIASDKAFELLDANGDDFVSHEELRVCFPEEYSENPMCNISEEQISELIQPGALVDKLSFFQNIWGEVKDSFSFQKETSEPQMYEDIVEEDSALSEDEDAEFDEMMDEEATQSGRMPPYTPDIQVLVDEAEAARKALQDHEAALRSLESSLTDAQKLQTIDFGPDNVFLKLYNECFEYSEHTFKYTFCPFQRASQQSKSGSGGEVNIGRWGHWAVSSGAEDSKYSKMILDGGTTCWNGPARSLHVTLRCGTVNKILSATEPSMCEYHMEFETPASCSVQYDLGEGKPLGASHHEL